MDIGVGVGADLGFVPCPVWAMVLGRPDVVDLVGHQLTVGVAGEPLIIPSHLMNPATDQQSGVLAHALDILLAPDKTYVSKHQTTIGLLLPA